MYYDIPCSSVVTEAERKSEQISHTKPSWVSCGFYIEDLGRNWLHYNGTLYYETDVV